MNFLINLYKGRINRRNIITGWIFFNVLFLILFLMPTVIALLTGGAYGGTDRNVMFKLTYVLNFLRYIFLSSLFAKRSHDIGWSGWFSILVFVPYVSGLVDLAILVMALIPGQNKDNKYGSRPKPKFLSWREYFEAKH